VQGKGAAAPSTALALPGKWTIAVI
jgi:hypothetical protein